MSIRFARRRWWLDSVKGPRLAIYNAGTDVLVGDSTGRLDVSFSGVQARDAFVVSALARRNIPTLILTSGGYTRSSRELVAHLARQVIDLMRPRVNEGCR